MGVGDAAGRVGEMVELVTTLDRRIAAALDAVAEMNASMARLDDVGADGRVLVAEMRERAAALDERLNRDLDTLRDAVLAKLDSLDAVRDAVLEKVGSLDTDTIGARFDRMERALFDIERATVSLDRRLEAALEALPGFMTRRVKDEEAKAGSDPSGPRP